MFIKEVCSRVFSRLLTCLHRVLSCHSRVGGNLLNAFIVVFFLASCSDLGDRDNPLDPGASNYVTSKESDEDSSSSKSIQSSSSSKKTEVSSSSKDSKPVEVSSSSKKSESSSSVNQSSSEKSSESRSSSSSNKANSSSSVTQISSGNISSSSSKKIESSSSKTASSSSTNTLSSSSNKQESILGYCSVAIADSVGLVGSTYYICKSGKWEEASVVEYDTYKWNAGKFDGEVRAGQVNKTIYYIYEASKKLWRNATTIEKDTYDYKNNKDWAAGADGQIQKGAVTDSIYVFDKTVWRAADNIEKVLGGCVTAIADSVGKAGSTYYICNPRKWIVATVLQYDTYKKECLTDGSIVDGNVIPSNKYVCDDGIFRAATENDVRAELGCTSYTREEFRILSGQYSYYKCESEGWLFTTEKLNQGTMIDERDGRVYKTIGIKTQMWMAENLNYADSTSYPSMKGRNWCMSDPDSCSKYGRYYTWSAVIDSVYWSKQGKNCGYNNDPDEYSTTCGIPLRIQGICPEGYHLPSLDEWRTMFTSVGNDYKGIQSMGQDVWGKATNQYGFSALPITYCNGTTFCYIDKFAAFWSAEEDSDPDRSGIHAYAWWIETRKAGVGGCSKQDGFSVRCIKDEE